MRESIHCNIIRDLLPGYADDLLSEESKEVVEAHMEDCVSCREYWKNMQEMLEEKQSWNGEEIKEQEIDYLAKIRRYGHRLLLSGLMISFFLGAALYITACSMPLLFSLSQGGSIPEYLVRRLELVWWLVGLKMLTAGSLTALLYMTFQVLVNRGGCGKKDRYVRKLFCQCLVFAICCILVFPLHQPWLVLAGIAGVLFLGLKERKKISKSS